MMFHHLSKVLLYNTLCIFIVINSVDVTLVLFDSDGRLMSSDDAMKILDNEDVVNKMRESGYDISGFRQVSPTTSGVEGK